MRIDRVPWYLQPLVAIYGYALGVLLFVHYWINHRTVRIRYAGREHLVPGRNYVFVLWHGDFPSYFTAFFHHEHHAWIGHPLVYMKPIWVFLRFLGVETTLLGSSGHNGRDAAEQLVKALRAGSSTTIAPDGPSGPPKTLKKGVLHIAAGSGVEIVPLRFTPSPSFTVSGWDTKRYPVPFGRLDVEIGTPLFVSVENLDAAADSVRRALNARSHERRTS
jgi:lysophospholipid acyltransferase (LPLAT)-like uncharacterized protein